MQRQLAAQHSTQTGLQAQSMPILLVAVVSRLAIRTSSPSTMLPVFSKLTEWRSSPPEACTGTLAERRIGQDQE